MANDCGITHVTARQWLNLLEMCYVIYLLPPYYKNFNKRIVKSPKIYFYDTGLLCYLLNILSPEQIDTHFAKGPIFENFIIGDMLKLLWGENKTPALYFWRDNHGHEIDLIYEAGAMLMTIEIKSGKTILQDYFKNIRYFNTLAENTQNYVLYNGCETQKREFIRVTNAREFLTKGLND